MKTISIVQKMYEKEKYWELPDSIQDDAILFMARLYDKAREAGVREAVEFLSHDIKFCDEGQRKAAVKMYLTHWKEKNKFI